MKSINLFSIWSICGLLLIVWLPNGSSTNSVDYARVLAQLPANTETVQVGGFNIEIDNLIQQAVNAGMNREAVEELMRTKQPVVISNTDAQGNIARTTYKLTPSGAISKQTITEQHSPIVTNLAEKTITDTKGSNTNIESDWEWVPSQTNRRTSVFTRPTIFDDNFGNTNWPNFYLYGNRPSVVETPTDTWRRNYIWYTWPKFEMPKIDNVTPRVSTKTEVDDQGRTITTTSTVYSNVPAAKWPETNVHSIFDDNIAKPTFVSTNTERTINNFSAITNTPEPLPAWDNVPGGIRTTTPLPSLDEFLKAQYGNSTKVYTYDLNTFGANSVTSTTPRIVNINLDELPITTSVGHEMNNNNNNRTDDMHVTHEVGTKTSTLSQTVKHDGIPGLSDLNPNIQEVLQRAGFNDDEIRQAYGNSLTRTRIEPDGRIIKTTYRVRTVPRTYTLTSTTLDETNNITGAQQAAQEIERQLPSLEPSAARSYSHKQERSVFPEITSFVSRVNPIDEFLAKVNIRADDIKAQNGELIRNIVDDLGRVLSVSFILSEVKTPQPNEELKLLK